MAYEESRRVAPCPSTACSSKNRCQQRLLAASGRGSSSSAGFRAAPPHAFRHLATVGRRGLRDSRGGAAWRPEVERDADSRTGTRRGRSVVTRLGLAWISRKPATLQLPLRRHLHVGRRRRAGARGRACLARAVRIADGDIVHGFRVRAQQPWSKTELPDQRHLLLQVRRRAESRRRLRRVEHFGGAELLLVGGQRILRAFGDRAPAPCRFGPVPDICASVSYQAPASALANFCPAPSGRFSTSVRTTVRSRISPGICDELKSDVTPFCFGDLRHHGLPGDDREAPVSPMNAVAISESQVLISGPS